jgi:hypothetical protein
MELKAIQTVYKGYQFRSRLEARWAVFFDGIGIKWDYEEQGFDLNGCWYLPDFHLSDFPCFVEIKPHLRSPGWDKAQALVQAGAPVLVLQGKPWPWEYVPWIGGVYGLKELLPFPTGQFALCKDCSARHLALSSHDSERHWGSLFEDAKCPMEHILIWCRPNGILRRGPCPRHTLEGAYLAARQARF